MFVRQGDVVNKLGSEKQGDNEEVLPVAGSDSETGVVLQAFDVYVGVDTALGFKL